jgi:hypothetical protein
MVLSLKKIIIILGLFFLHHIHSSSASIIPIIETNGESKTIAINQEYTIIWIVIDDNPSRYEIKQNNSLIKYGKIDSSMINLTISLPIGLYYYSIFVFDYSGNNISNIFQLEVVSSVPDTSSWSSETIAPTDTVHGTDMSSAISGFGLVSVILVFITIGMIFYLKRK